MVSGFRMEVGLRRKQRVLVVPSQGPTPVSPCAPDGPGSGTHTWPWPPRGTGVGGGVFRVCSQGFFREDAIQTWASVFVHKLLLEQPHLRVVCGSFHVTMAELSSSDRTRMVCKTKTTYCLALCEGKFADCYSRPPACCPVEIHVSYTKFLVAPVGKKKQTTK